MPQPPTNGVVWLTSGASTGQATPPLTMVPSPLLQPAASPVRSGPPALPQLLLHGHSQRTEVIPSA